MNTPESRRGECYRTAAELAVETRKAFDNRPPKSSKQRFQDLVRRGWINARGQITTLLGGDADPETEYQTWSQT